MKCLLTIVMHPNLYFRMLDARRQHDIFWLGDFAEDDCEIIQVPLPML